jgi:hypothetical protein
MKNTSLLVALSLCLFFVIGTLAGTAGEKKISKKQVPKAVLSAFQSQYPNATIKGQSVETENSKKFYEIESVEGTTHRDLLYEPDGTVAEIEESMDLATLPSEMKNTVEKEFPKGKIVKAEKVTHDSTSTYEFQVKVGKKTHEVKLDASGNVLKSKKGEENEGNEKEEEEEDND